MSVVALSRRAERWRTVLYHTVVITLGFVMLYPLLWMIASSLKPADEVFSSVTSLIPRHITFDNYIQGWAGFGDELGDRRRLRSGGEKGDECDRGNHALHCGAAAIPVPWSGCEFHLDSR